MTRDELLGKILWCARQKTGIKIVDASENLCSAYLKKSAESLKAMNLNFEARIYGWAVDAAYYARYQAIYALLQKCGIKCEIQDCSIMLMRFLFSEKLSEKLLQELETAKEQRVNLVYYTNRLVSEADIKKNIDSAAGFVLSMEKIISEISAEEISAARAKLKKILL